VRHKYFVISILFIVALLFAGCGGATEETPEQAVTNALNGIKQLNQETMERYFQSGNPMGDIEEDEEELLKLLVENINFNIISSSVDGDSAIVETEITNINIGNIFGELIGEVMMLVFAGIEITDEDMDQLLVELLERPYNETVTNTVNISLTKDDDVGGWIINTNDELEDAIFGGMFSTVDGILDF